MISLTSVEEKTRSILEEPELELVAVNLPDDKKGEHIILLIEGVETTDGLQHSLQQGGLNPLAVPSKIFVVDKVPKLGSGKTDFSASKKLAMQLLTS